MRGGFLWAVKGQGPNLNFVPQILMLHYTHRELFKRGGGMALANCPPRPPPPVCLCRLPPRAVRAHP
jgi:hypothetical protein